MSLPPKTRLYLGYLCATLAGYALVAGILLYALVPLKWIILIVAGLLGLVLLAVAVSWLLLVRGHPLLALACVLYLCAALTGGGVLTIVAVQRRKELTS